MNLLRNAIGESDEHIDEHELMRLRPQQNSSTSSQHFISSQLIYLINEANSQNRNISARERNEENPVFEFTIELYSDFNSIAVVFHTINFIARPAILVSIDIIVKNSKTPTRRPSLKKNAFFFGYLKKALRLAHMSYLVISRKVDDLHEKLIQFVLY